MASTLQNEARSEREHREAHWERERQCKHVIPHDRCESALESTKPCDGPCGDYFCADHLYDGFCKGCFEVEEAAEALAVAA